MRRTCTGKLCKDSSNLISWLNLGPWRWGNCTNMALITPTLAFLSCLSYNSICGRLGSEPWESLMCPKFKSKFYKKELVSVIILSYCQNVLLVCNYSLASKKSFVNNCVSDITQYFTLLLLLIWLLLLLIIIKIKIIKMTGISEMSIVCERVCECESLCQVMGWHFPVCPLGYTPDLQLPCVG